MTVGRFAFVAGDRQIWTMTDEGTNPRQMTFAEGPGARSPWGVMESRDHCAWPCWSPDGRWLSCFQTQVGPGGDGTVWLSAMEVDGIEEQRLVAVDEGIPIYTQWSPDSTKLAVLTQDEDHLSLGLCQLGALGRYRVVEEGVPLFFSWTRDAQRLIIHSGSAGETRLVLRDVTGAEPDEIFRKAPGNFCTPVVVGNQAVFVGRDETHGVLCVSDWAGQRIEGLTGIEGIVAVVASGCGRYLAFSAAPPGNHQPYQGLWVVDLETARIKRISSERLVAFFWLPDASGLVVVTRGRGPAQMLWARLPVEGGDIEPLASFYPNLDQKFFLHYFEQFAVSHSPVSADGRRLVFASHPDPSGRGVDTTPHVCTLNLDGSPPRVDVVAPGDFAVCSP